MEALLTDTLLSRQLLQSPSLNPDFPKLLDLFVGTVLLYEDVHLQQELPLYRPNCLLAFEKFTMTRAYSVQIAIKIM